MIANFSLTRHCFHFCYHEKGLDHLKSCFALMQYLFSKARGSISQALKDFQPMIAYHIQSFKLFIEDTKYNTNDFHVMFPNFLTLNYFFQKALIWRYTISLSDFVENTKAGVAIYALFTELGKLYILSKECFRTQDQGLQSIIITTLSQVTFSYFDKEKSYELFKVHHLKAYLKVEVLYLGYLALLHSIYHLCKILYNVM